METVRKKFQVEEIRIRVPWGEIAAKCWNSAKYEPVLVVHGLSENAGSFDRLIPLLSDKFYFVAVDLPGHGWSSSFPHGLPLEFMHYVGQLRRVVEHFQWEKTNLMGHSLGAHLLQFFAATYPKLVTKLIMIDALLPTPVSRDVFLLFHENRAREAMKLEITGDVPPRSYTYEEALAHVTRERLSKLTPEAAAPLLDRCLVKTGSTYIFVADPRARSEIKPAIEEDVLFDLIRRIKCPTLVILAEDSEHFGLLNFPEFYSTATNILMRSHVCSTVVRVAGNHCVHNNQPEVIAPIVDKFLREGQCKY